MTTRTFSFALALTAASPALAGDEPTEKGFIYSPKQLIDFTNPAHITGEIVRPAGAFTLARRRAEFNPMIHLRADFVPEMVQSVDEMK